ncbi:MAG: hypothetical protein JNL74_20600 [Fibrobacteres bacterium]|nr:hypothetical protein [Fibrobacterota bacterium]
MFKKNLLIVGSLFAASVPLFIITLLSASRAMKIAGLGHTMSETSEDGFRAASDDYTKLLGLTGTAVTPLRTAGSVILDGTRYDVVSDGSYIEKDEQIKVIEIVGNRIVVSKV